ncbi:MAG: D-alanyl-D-alanine carboxypeptidase/D-alanyl-D-alanine endopeptidase, partial [Bryobacteraceae bacterium]
MEDRVRALAASAPAVMRGFWGARVIRLDTGDVLIRENARRNFVPASNVKLFSTALALDRLGPDHRFITTVVAEVPVLSDGVVRGDLRLIGGGDPTMSARETPYRKGPAAGDPMAGMEALVDQIVTRGVRRVEGNVIGDDTAYLWQPHAGGWAQDDVVFDYGAAVSALVFNDNVLTLLLRPAENPGEPATIRLVPPLAYFAIDNRVTTVASGAPRVKFDRLPGTRQLILWGALREGSAGTAIIAAVEDPARLAAFALRDALVRRGVTVTGEAFARHRRPWDPVEERPGFELARRTSPPLIEVLKITNKASQNLYAEIARREVARVRRNDGSLEGGLAEMREFLSEIGLSEGLYRLEDGSGLSRLNLVTPSVVVRLLEFMAARHGDPWIDTLPVGGEDGTLSTRFRDMPRASFVQAKTGSLSGVNTLSGYATTSRGERLAFSLMVNNTITENSRAPAEVRLFLDRAAAILAE